MAAWGAPHTYQYGGVFPEGGVWRDTNCGFDYVFIRDSCDTNRKLVRKSYELRIVGCQNRRETLAVLNHKMRCGAQEAGKTKIGPLGAMTIYTYIYKVYQNYAIPWAIDLSTRVAKNRSHYCKCHKRRLARPSAASWLNSANQEAGRGRPGLPALGTGSSFLSGCKNYA